MNSLIYQGLKINELIQKHEFINFKGAKFIVSTQKHEFINLQRAEVYCINPETRMH